MAARLMPIQFDKPEPAGSLMVEGVEISKQPPYVMAYCKAPETRYVGEPCGMKSVRCSGESWCCGMCGHNFCEHHFRSHTRRMRVHADVARAFLHTYQSQARQRARGERKKFCVINRKGIDKGDLSDGETEALE